MGQELQMAVQEKENRGAKFGRYRKDHQSRTAGQTCNDSPGDAIFNILLWLMFLYCYASQPRRGCGDPSNFNR